MCFWSIPAVDYIFPERNSLEWHYMQGSLKKALAMAYPDYYECILRYAQFMGPSDEPGYHCFQIDGCHHLIGDIRLYVEVPFSEQYKQDAALVSKAFIL